MINVILGRKLNMSVLFDEKGKRMPVTLVEAGPCPVVQIKTREKDGYSAIQLGFGKKKKVVKPLLGHLKKASLSSLPRFLREIEVGKEDDIPEIGSSLKVNDVLETGDLVKVTGVSKGKGFTGVVKRWGFAGGPRTHGQSDRERAPGSIGQTTTPGRVYKGKKMAGRAGGEKVTVRGLRVVGIDAGKNQLFLLGSVPGSRGSLLIIERTGKVKAYTPPLQEKKEEEAIEQASVEDREKEQGVTPAPEASGDGEQHAQE